jgi:D-sedoheptulose 7-phosphate isomerase
MDEKIKIHFIENTRVSLKFIENNINKIKEAFKFLCTTFKKGGKVIFFGNGGSAAQAEHFAAEIVNRYLRGRVALPALSLTTNPAVVTSLSNDFDYRDVFSYQLEALLKKEDTAIGLTTSGTSENIIRAFSKAKEISASTICFSGEYTQRLSPMVDLVLAVPSQNTALIQEVHLVLGHTLCELLEAWIVKERKMENEGRKRKTHSGAPFRI